MIGSDLIVLFGANVANAQPVFMKYLYLARKRGAKVAVVNPMREPGLERYWVPSNVESAMFGTKMADEFFSVHTGGDVAFINGVLKVLLAEGGIDRAFVREHTVGLRGPARGARARVVRGPRGASGATRADMERFARMYAAANAAVVVWSMGITQHETGTENVEAVVNLGLARGNVGRPGAGLMPIRGHSGVQGGAEMGAYATALPGGGPVTPEGAPLSEQYGFAVPPRPGLTAAEMLEAGVARRARRPLLERRQLPRGAPGPASRRRIGHVPVRVHQDIVLSSQMLVDGETVVLLPAATRYEQRGGGTETTTERRIAYSPEVAGPRSAKRAASGRSSSTSPSGCTPTARS